MDRHNRMAVLGTTLQSQLRPPMSEPESLEEAVVPKWLEKMRQSERQNAKDDPNYFVTDPKSLSGQSYVEDFIIGTGDDIFTHIAQAIENAESEVLFVTCFWARSNSLQILGQALKKLSTGVLDAGRPKVRVRIGFSSLSWCQKLFQTGSLLGRIYESREWEKTLGLPPCAELQGLDLRIKSIFVLPFSVMHPKFVIIDRRQVWLPSCNVSWETWFEGCIVFNGPIVQQFVTFWEAFWGRDEERIELPPRSHPEHKRTPTDTRNHPLHPFSSVHATLRATTTPHSAPTPLSTLFLPSPHHRNPHFRPPWLHPRPPPPTPLNTFTLTLLATASHTIALHTPNLTCAAVADALLGAVARGARVAVRTSAALMVVEQVGTAGTTTARAVRALVARYGALRRRGGPGVGGLRVEYFAPRGGAPGEPRQAHVKVLLVDARWVVLGSGNMDRASWFTSQEVGVAVCDGGVARRVGEMVGRAVDGRSRVVFDSDDLPD